MAGKGGTVQIPWYATGLRGDALQAALAKIAPSALNYGATTYTVTRQRDDRYKFLLTADFPTYEGFTEWWEGPEFRNFRIHNAGLFQLGVLYSWADKIVTGSASYAESA
ncbi:MAG: hypothetical protein F2799_03550 [Actinobacteria bacterium]|uniref:Unannotated protein n=1 Tax=freshwater metagenome TaxID=449393 RepID=A0A6J7DMN6_9ZZZZ|nr:hypothetical protein [Actinomycetota bacterium]